MPSRLPAMSEAEETEVLPVLAEDLRITRAAPAVEVLPGERRGAGVVIPAAAAAGGFVAGAAVIGLVGRRHRRSSALVKGRRTRTLGRRGRGSRGPSGPAELLQIVGSRSLLLDVHLLGGSGSDR
jgi:hypothetical protein